MDLSSLFKRKVPVSPAPAETLADDGASQQAARAQARRRLIGAVVLLAIGVVVFPLLFETQPRPLPSDVPIELPRREAPPPRVAVAPKNASTVTELPPVQNEAPATLSAVPAPAAPAERVEPAAAPAPASPPAPAPRSEHPPAASVALGTAASKPQPAGAPPATAATAAPAKASAAATATPATTALAATSASQGASAATARFVVQVGAYTDAGTLRDVRAKVEKLGLKTYTQTIQTEAGMRTRVRVGPFPTRQEAEAASGRLKAGGLPGNVLVL